MQQPSKNLGVGLGLRRHYIDEIATNPPAQIDWYEIAPENYIDRGGPVYENFLRIAAKAPIVAHGLMLSIGSLDELNWEYLKKLKAFLREFKIPWFSDHLCFSSRHGHYLHDLLPLPFTREAINHVSERARIVQDFLEVPFALENVSYYLQPQKPEMQEWEFVREILHKSGVSLMLDVNNVFVNAVNHGVDAREYLRQVAQENILQIHIAGHDREAEDLIIDTHGQPVCEDVWDLLGYLGELRELPPVLIERDGNFPPLEELLAEIEHAKTIWQSSRRGGFQTRPNLQHSASKIRAG